MNTYSVRRRTLLATGLASAMLVGACEDKRVKELDKGISRDSAVKVIEQDAKPAPAASTAPGATPDSFPNVYWRERFLVAGKNYEILYFTPDNTKMPMPRNGGMMSQDSVPYGKLTPLVFVDNRLIGRGWGFWDSVSTTLKVPLKKR
jgi:hypothetical protein